MDFLKGQDLENMSRNDLLKLIKCFYKCIDDSGYRGLTVGKYYHMQQTGMDELEVFTDDGLEFFDFKFVDKCFANEEN